jgi:HAE1 family hydrophobic/amphiphilic exporter-1
MDDEDIETVQATVGSGGGAESIFMGLAGGDSSRASVFATLDEEFDGDPDEIADRVRDELEELDVTGPVTFTVSAGAGGGMQGNLYDLQIQSDDEAALREANDLVLAALRDPDNWEDYDEVPIINLESNLAAARDVVAVDVDPSRALERGLTAAQVGFALRQVLESQELGEVSLAGTEEGDEDETLTVEARFPADTIGSIEALRQFEIAGPAGPVCLGDVADIEVRPGPVVITRIDGERAALLSAEISDEDTLGVIAAADTIIEDLDLPEGVEAGAGVETRTQQEGFEDTLLALPISIVIIYLIMALTFGSLVHPFTILFSLPFAVSGALVALAATGRPLSISSLIGLLMLVGIVATNAIVLVDLVQQYRERGMTAREALVRGGRVRLRPILMTALATVFALFPMALGFTEGAIIAAELATVVIGGLVTSTFLTLIVVPVVYSLLDGLTGRGRPAQPGTPPPPPPTPATDAVAGG